MQKKKVIISSILILIIVVLSIFVFINKDKLFENKVVIAYSNGCEEIYIDAELITDKCVEEPKRKKLTVDLQNFTIGR